MPLPDRLPVGPVIDRFRMARRLRLGFLLFWRGLPRTAHERNGRAIDPEAQRQRWDERTLAAERFHWATRQAASPQRRDAPP